MDYQEELKQFTPKHDFFIGIDSDGCVFDSMEVKQKEFFIPNALKYFNLFPASKTVRETWEFVNLYSAHRGNNRFIAILKVFELLEHRPEIMEANVILPDLTPLREWSETETRLGNAALREYYEETGDKRLEKVLLWSEKLNIEISEWLHGIPPFKHALEAIESISAFADILVVSQTPLEALQNEWIANDIMRYAAMIAAQEHGSKTEHLTIAAKLKYSDSRIMMIGDAKGDLEAAQINGVLFYPVMPGNEEKSWKRFCEEGMNRFLSGTYKGAFEDSLIDEFKNSLPENPTWKTY